MTEVIGKCISNTLEKMIILDLDDDEIEMYHLGDMHNEKIQNYFNSLVGSNISFFYNEKGIKVRKLDENEEIIYEIGRQGLTRRTMKSLMYNEF